MDICMAKVNPNYYIYEKKMPNFHGFDFREMR